MTMIFEKKRTPKQTNLAVGYIGVLIYFML